MLAPDAFLSALRDAHARTLALLDGLDGPEWLGPELTIVNPPLWEVGHVAWFTEHWVLRHVAGRAPLRADADALYDSAAVHHEVRWRLPLPDPAATLRYLDDVVEQCAEVIGERGLDGELAELAHLSLFHHDMHNEAFAYTWQTLGYPLPGRPAAAAEPGEPVAGDVEIEGGEAEVGAAPALGFAFDNEGGRHVVAYRPFRIARAQVTQRELAAFVDDGGYLRREAWTDAGWRWRERADARHPVYWRRAGRDRWQRRLFDRWVDLEPELPAVHVCWHEAQAFCRWAGRRLPTEVEWEVAAGPGRRRPWGEGSDAARANTDYRCGGLVPVGAFAAGDSAHGVRQMVGNTWEWTADPFSPYPGFRPGHYRDYSEPWFGTRQVLRGGAWTTAARMLRTSFRNYYEPWRRDVWCGFRTCASDRE